MRPLLYIDRLSGQVEEEKVYGDMALRLVYGTRWIGPLLLPLVRHPLISRLYGWWQKQSFSRKKIKPFIEKFEVDSEEFLKPVESFQNFNEFFVRRLKPDARPVDPNSDTLVLPADGRYRFFPSLDSTGNFSIKSTEFDLSSLLMNETLAERYHGGSMVLARLCPTDYHRFHFPCDGTPSSPKLINGHLYSVNPLAIRKYGNIYSQNRRCLCEIQHPDFGPFLYMEVGATNVGSITQTYKPYQKVSKGDEKGFFAFGASALVLLFPKNTITFDADLIELGEKGLEIRGLMGQSMARINK